MEKILEELAHYLFKLKNHFVFLNIMGGNYVTIALTYASLLFNVNPVFAIKKYSQINSDSEPEVKWMVDFLKLKDFTNHEKVSRYEVKILLLFEEFLSNSDLKNQKLMTKKYLIGILEKNGYISPSKTIQSRYFQLETIIKPFLKNKLLSEKDRKIFFTRKGFLTTKIYSKYFG